MKTLMWIAWGILSVALAGYFAYTLLMADDKSTFIIGEASHGHHQIELACESCHTDAFGAGEVLQDACENCHAEELKLARDSHPKKKFTDPRNAELLQVIDARYCVSCHTEHQAEKTLEMGLTLPKDYCFHCHETVGEDRPSHKDLAYDSCATSGCHNFHDNLALYEDFLVEHQGKPWLNDRPFARLASYAKNVAPKGQVASSQELEKISQLTQKKDVAAIQQQWSASAHAGAQVGCNSCHLPEGDGEWQAKPAVDQCQSCHEQEWAGFTQGKHGMRLSANLSKTLGPMTPAKARLAFHPESHDSELTCGSCHDVHQLNLQEAASDSCMGCHADEHTQAFPDSPHGELWQKVREGELNAEQGVSCATCHLPKTTQNVGGMDVHSVQHNQNWNLKPNEKMIRSVCLQCHSLEFSIDALADPELIRTNFNGKPNVHIDSVDWAVRRAKR